MEYLQSPCLLASPHLILNTRVIEATINQSYYKTIEIEQKNKRDLKKPCGSAMEKIKEHLGEFQDWQY